MQAARTVAAGVASGRPSMYERSHSRSMPFGARNPKNSDSPRKARETAEKSGGICLATRVSE